MPKIISNGISYAGSPNIDNKMDKDNPTGTGSLSINGKPDTTVGNYSVTLGYDNEASGNYSHSEGYYTSASGDCSHAGGNNTTAGYIYQTAIGKYNDNKSTSIFEVGNGTPDVRSNALELTTEGQLTTAGDIINGNGVSLDELLDKLTWKTRLHEFTQISINQVINRINMRLTFCQINHQRLVI